MAKTATRCQEKNEEKLTGRDEAIAHCERELDEAERRIPELKASLQTFKNNKKLGRPWPRTSATRN